MRTPSMQHATPRAVAAAAALALSLVLAACGGQREQEVQPEQVVKVDVEQRPLEATVAETDGVARPLAVNPFEFAWDLRLPAPVHATWMSPNLKGLWFVQLTTGEVHGIDVFSGVTRWTSRPLPKPITLPPFVQRMPVLETSTGQTRYEERLYIISGDQLFVIDCAYGQLIWRHEIGKAGQYGFQPASGPYAAGIEKNLRVFVGDWEGRVRVITWNAEYERPYVTWQWNLRAVPTAQPDGHEELVYVGDRGGTLSCFGMDRDLLWTYDAKSPILGGVLVRGRSVYFGANDNVLHVLNRLSGAELGNLYLGAPIRRPPFAFDAEPLRVYAWTEGSESQSGLRAIHTADDNILLRDVQLDYDKHLEVSRLGEEWFLPGITRLVGSSPKYLYAMRPGSSVVLAVDRDSGDVAWHWDLNGEREDEDHHVVHVTEYVDPSDEVRAIVTVDREGRVVAYRLFGSDDLTASQ